MDYLSQTRLIKSGFLIIPLSKLDFCCLMVWHYMIYPKSIIPHMEKIIGWGQISQSAGFVFLSQIAVHNNVKKKKKKKITWTITSSLLGISTLKTVDFVH